MKIKVIVFDDNPTRRDGLEMMINLTPDMECIGTFPDCRQVVEMIQEKKPDVVLMDIDMPYTNGLEGVKLARKHFSELKIIMQTVFEDDEKIFACIRAGADGYILKKTPPHDLLKGIIEVMEGGAPMTPSVARQVLRLCSEPGYQKESHTFDLTNREAEILGLLVKGLSYKMIADKCSVSLATVSTHIRHIYEKLQVQSGTEAVAKAIQHKIV
ncbi:MAG: response regulator [Chitinophagaceae bacterium]